MINSGDWVESLTAIIEHHDGMLELVKHEECMHCLYSPAARQAAAVSRDSSIRVITDRHRSKLRVVTKP